MKKMFLVGVTWMHKAFALHRFNLLFSTESYFYQNISSYDMKQTYDIYDMTNLLVLLKNICVPMYPEVS